MCVATLPCVLQRCCVCCNVVECVAPCIFINMAVVLATSSVERKLLQVKKTNPGVPC